MLSVAYAAWGLLTVGGSVGLFATAPLALLSLRPAVRRRLGILAVAALLAACLGGITVAAFLSRPAFVAAAAALAIVAGLAWRMAGLGRAARPAPPRPRPDWRAEAAAEAAARAALTPASRADPRP